MNQLRHHRRRRSTSITIIIDDWMGVHRHIDPLDSVTAGGVLGQLAPESDPPPVLAATRVTQPGRSNDDRKLITSAGVACVVIGPAALFGQALLTPVSAGGDTAAQVADAASDLSAMRWALVPDAPLLLFVPAVLFAGVVAGARQSRVAAVGAGLAFIGTLAAVFLLANDILVYEAATSNDAGAVTFVEDYQHNTLFATMLVLYIAGLAIGCVLLAVAMWRQRAVPRWAPPSRSVPSRSSDSSSSQQAPPSPSPASARARSTLRRPGANPSPAANTWSGGLEQRAIVGMEDVAAPSA